QNYGSANVTVPYYVFDLLVLRGEDLTPEPLSSRQAILKQHVLPALHDSIRESPELNASLSEVTSAIQQQGLEGIVAKRRSSSYEPGKRTGAWRKMRINQIQQFVIGGYTVGGPTFDALIFRYYEAGKLLYAARTRSGFTPSLRQQLHKKLRILEI